MALAPIDAICPHCQARFTLTPKRTFLGFQKMTCPECKENVVYPLTREYRITCWALFVFMILTIVGSFSRGGISVPGGLRIAVGIALIRDWSIKNRVAANVLRANSNAGG